MAFEFPIPDTNAKGDEMKKRLLLSGLMLGAAPHAYAQLYGTQPDFLGDLGFFKLFMFDPDTLTWMDGQNLDFPGFAMTGMTAITIHPKDPIPIPPATPTELEGTLYAVVRLSGVSGRVLVTIDPTTAVVTQIGNLGDNFATLAFRDDGQLFGVTGDGASVPETLYSIDKFTAAKTLVRSLGAGADGEVIAYHPDQLFYHWSGNGTVVFESVEAVPPHTVSNIPITGGPSFETFGAHWDPCQMRDPDGAGPLPAQRVFITAHGANTTPSFRFYTPTGVVSDVVNTPPTGIRGLALIGGSLCEVDLGLGVSPTPLFPAANDPIQIDFVVDNAGQARAMNPVLTINLPASISAATTTGCLEDPNGLPTCTLKIDVQRIDLVFGYVPFRLSNLWRGRSVSVRINGTFNGQDSTLTASVASGSDETEPADNSISLDFRNAVFSNGFEGSARNLEQATFQNF